MENLEELMGELAELFDHLQTGRTTVRQVTLFLS